MHCAAAPTKADLTTDELALLSDYQHSFPLCSRPFDAIASKVGCSEERAIGHYRQWLAQGRISRIGPVFAPQRVGASILAAISVSPEQLAQAAALVNAYPEVNHNYEREHTYKLWFVVAAPTQARLDAVLDGIARQCNTSVLRLPLLEQYHIDLGFSLNGGAKTRSQSANAQPACTPQTAMNDADRAFIAAIQTGLTICPQPYQVLADRLGTTQEAVLQRIRAWLDSGMLKRFGVVLRHHEFGYTANAMVVHDIPDPLVSELGQRLGQHPAVTLCYRRPRVEGQWRSNLFCMLHGRDRAVVEQQIDKMRQDYGLQEFPHAVLFSRERFKQTGARYASTPTVAI